jgi:hypothetical protein
MDEAEGGCWEVRAEGEQGVQGRDCGWFGDGYGEGWRVVSSALSGFGEEVRCLLSPERFFTKICMVSSGSADGAREEVEETLEMLLERMMAVVEVDLWMMVAMMRRLLSGGREERWCDREDQWREVVGSR